MVRRMLMEIYGKITNLKTSPGQAVKKTELGTEPSILVGFRYFFRIHIQFSVNDHIRVRFFRFSGQDL